jgi:hypothetical protein
MEELEENDQHVELPLTRLRLGYVRRQHVGLGRGVRIVGFAFLQWARR